MSQFREFSIDWHTHIMDLVQKTGLGLNSAGLCYGGAWAAIAAFQGGQNSIDAFIDSVNASYEFTEKRLDNMKMLLENDLEEKLRAPLKQMWLATLQKAKDNNPNFSAADEKLLRTEFNQSEEVIEFRKTARSKIFAEGSYNQKYMDTLALLQNIKIYYDASEYSHLLPENTMLRSQGTVLDAIPIFQPDFDNPHTAIVLASNDCFPYKKNDLTEMLAAFVKNCDSLQVPLSLALESNNHEISCSYDPISKKWLIFDINLQPYYGTVDVNDVSDFVWHGLMTNIVNTTKDTLILHSEIITTARHIDSVNKHFDQPENCIAPAHLSTIEAGDMLESFFIACRYNCNKSIEEMARLPCISETVLKAAIASQIKWNRLESLSTLIAAPAATPDLLDYFLKLAIQQKSIPLIHEFGSSPKISNVTKIRALIEAINNDDSEIVRTLASSFVNSVTILEAGLTHALNKKNEAAVEAIESSGHLSKEDIQKCKDEHAARVAIENRENIPAPPTSRNFIGKARNVADTAAENAFKKISVLTQKFKGTPS